MSIAPIDVFHINIVFFSDISWLTRVKRMSETNRLYLETPIVESIPLSKKAGFKVFLKLDNLQPPGSFKIRGVSHFCQKAVKERGCKRLICASGGNAGMAAAYAAQQLKTPCTIVLPESTPAFLADKLRDYGAEVIVKGKVFDHANKYALELAAQPGSEYVHPFDLPDIWEGHTSMIRESVVQLKQTPEVVVTCVGGGGLLNGVVQGMRQVGWNDVPIVAMETVGADCFRKAIEAGELVTIPDITSIAKSLGSLVVSKTTLDYYRDQKPPIISAVVQDVDVVKACLQFADDHRFLVEPACGASLSAVYSGVIKKLQEEGKLGDISSALVIVCGGSVVTLEMLQKWKKDFNI